MMQKIKQQPSHLDFTMIKAKLADVVEGEGWAPDFADRVEEEYRKFLALTRYYPEMAIVPSSLVDKFWHYHILDTQKYGPDCQDYFGYFLHHFPYFGMRGTEDARNLAQSWLNTLDVYRDEFGAPPEDIWDQGTRCPKCGRVEPYAMPRYAS